MSEVAKECELLMDSESGFSVGVDLRDYEVSVDSLASWTGLLYSMCSESQKGELVWICDMLYHLSAALRKGYCLDDEETATMVDYSHKYDEFIVRSIVLPLSDSKMACYCHIARSECRKIIVLLRKFNDVADVDPRLFDAFDSLANYYFGLAMSYTGDKKHLFQSRVY